MLVDQGVKGEALRDAGLRESLIKTIQSSVKGRRRVIHIPFERDTLFAAFLLYDSHRCPDGALSYFSRDAYADWGLLTGID